MNKSINKKIYELRKARSLTQEQLGQKLGISGQAVSKWEKSESLPDIMVLPQLCDILGISIDALLEVPASQKNKNIMKDFSLYAREKGKGKTFLSALSKIFSEHSDPRWADFGSDYLRVYDESGMGFIIDGEEYIAKCMKNSSDEVAFILRILSNEDCLLVLRCLSIDKATTTKEISKVTKIVEGTVETILLGLMKRNIIDCDIDAYGKRGYLFGNSMAGVIMILSGCQIIGSNGACNSYMRLSRKKR